MKAIVMAPSEQARWRRRFVLTGMAAAIVLVHGWGLGTVGRGTVQAAERVSALTVRSIVPPESDSLGDAGVSSAPAAMAVPAVQAAPRVPGIGAEAVPDARGEAAAPQAAEPEEREAEGQPAEAVPVAAGQAASAPDVPAPADVTSAAAETAGEAVPAPPGGTPDGGGPDPSSPRAAGAAGGALVAVAAATAAPAGAAAATPSVEVPVYPTRLPAAFTTRYTLHRGLLSGRGSLVWGPSADGTHYEARLEGSVGGFSVLDWTSSGSIDRAGVAPERFLVRRRGRDAQAANFQRQAGKITYSGPSVQYDLPVGAQDRLSWMVQIGGVLNASPKRYGVGSHLSFFVSGARGDADLWQFTVLGLESVPAGSGGREIMALKLLREPRKPYDTRVEVWLDPQHDHRPVQARLVTAGNGDALELRIDD